MLIDETFSLFLNSRTLGILATASLAVPDANMREVSEPSDVLRLMEIGFKNRARSTTAMNERSSRSHRFLFHYLILGDKITGNYNKVTNDSMCIKMTGVNFFTILQCCYNPCSWNGSKEWRVFKCWSTFGRSCGK